jgi:hypothetical protein
VLVKWVSLCLFFCLFSHRTRGGSGALVRLGLEATRAPRARGGALNLPHQMPILAMRRTPFISTPTADCPLVARRLGAAIPSRLGSCGWKSTDRRRPGVMIPILALWMKQHGTALPRAPSSTPASPRECLRGSNEASTPWVAARITAQILAPV